MFGYQHLEISNVSGTAGNVTLVRFLDRKIIDTNTVHKVGEELFRILEEEQLFHLLLNFSQVEVMATALLNKLISLQKKLKEHEGRLQLCHLRPELQEVFAITRLDSVFDINQTEKDALAKP